jgi:hypothetical protein
MSKFGFRGEFRETVIFSCLGWTFALAAVFVEFRYNCVEKAIGRYLAWNNGTRQESGQIWKTVQLSENVRQRLDDLVTRQREETSITERIDGLGQLIEIVRTRERVVMTRDRFLEMYSDLPLYQSSLVIDPESLVELIGHFPAWQRTMIVLEEGALNFYLVDGLNNVLEKMSLAGEYVEFYLAEKGTRASGLEAFPWLGGKVYPVDVFYDSWARLTPEERAGIPLSSLELISWRYRLQRVAVNQQSLIGDRMEMGFELSGDEGLGTVRLLAKSLSVLRMVIAMDSLYSQRKAAGIVSPGTVPAPGDTLLKLPMPVTPR